MVAPLSEPARPSELILVMGLGDKSLFDRLNAVRRISKEFPGMNCWTTWRMQREQSIS